MVVVFVPRFNPLKDVDERIPASRDRLDRLREIGITLAIVTEIKEDDDTD